MWYLLVENNRVKGVQADEPNAPDSVTVYPISDDDFSKINNQTHYWDIDTAQIVAQSAEYTAQKEQMKRNGIEREYLNSTDWKILRHIRQKHLGITTSLTEAEYTELEQQRQAAASRIIE